MRPDDGQNFLTDVLSRLTTAVAGSRDERHRHREVQHAALRNNLADHLGGVRPVVGNHLQTLANATDEALHVVR